MNFPVHEKETVQTSLSECRIFLENQVMIYKIYPVMRSNVEKTHKQGSFAYLNISNKALNNADISQ